ncbi:MAG: DUF421 domain-containing protein [Candidatus Saccharibacteria bacterium]
MRIDIREMLKDGVAYLRDLNLFTPPPALKLIEDEPTVVIHNGRILEHNMGKIRYNMDNLMSQLRAKSVYNIAEVEFAVLEPGGDLSVLLKPRKKGLQEVGYTDISLPGASEEIIVDGIVNYHNLRKNQLDEQWLIFELKKYGLNSARDITYACLDADGNLSLELDTNRDSGTSRSI